MSSYVKLELVGVVLGEDAKAAEKIISKAYANLLPMFNRAKAQALAEQRAFLRDALRNEEP